MIEAGKRDITSILIEGGSCLATSALQHDIVDRLMVFIAPMLLGKGIPAIGDLGIGRIADAICLGDIRIQRMGADLLCQARVRRVEGG
jgi:riboflavin biosynthesis pyrimidine reductase